MKLIESLYLDGRIIKVSSGKTPFSSAKVLQLYSQNRIAIIYELIHTHLSQQTLCHDTVNGGIEENL